jgi:hypothetical protein
MPLGVNFDLKSEFQTIHRRPFELAEPLILRPTNVRPLVDGEFLQLTTAYKMRPRSRAMPTLPSGATM